MLAILAAVASLWPPLPASVVRVIDGDTVLVDIPAWADHPFHRMSIRVVGIDTPEKRRPQAKCAAEVKLGLAASVYAHTLLKADEVVSFVFVGFDKYGDRFDANLTLPDGRDWAAVMIGGGYARAYDGGKKGSWCAHGKAIKP